MFLAAALFGLSLLNPVQSSDFDTVYKAVKSKHEECWKDLSVDMKAWKPFAIETLSNVDFSKFNEEQILQPNEAIRTRSTS